MKKCMGCMRDYSEENEKCPVCGYSEQQRKIDIERMPEALEPERILDGRYIIGRVLGYNDYSIKYIAWDALLQNRVVIKEYFPIDTGVRTDKKSKIQFRKPKDKKRFEAGRKIFDEEAVKLWKNQEIEGIVDVYRVFQENDTSYMVTEYLSGQTLQDYLDDLDSIETKVTLMDAAVPKILDAVEAAHRKKIGHKNLTPEQIYITDMGEIKLIGFGNARWRYFHNILKTDIYFEQESYIAPEILRGDNANLNADLYSIGVICYRILKRKELPVVKKKRARVKLPANGYKNVLRMLLTANPSKRPQSIEQLREKCGENEIRRLWANG